MLTAWRPDSARGLTLEAGRAVAEGPWIAQMMASLGTPLQRFSRWAGPRRVAGRLRANNPSMLATALRRATSMGVSRSSGSKRRIRPRTGSTGTCRSRNRCSQRSRPAQLEGLPCGSYRLPLLRLPADSLLPGHRALKRPSAGLKIGRQVASDAS
jgi:hypothetical protein